MPSRVEHLGGQAEVVGAALGPVVEDRAGALGRLGIGDRLADHVSKTLPGKRSSSASSV